MEPPDAEFGCFAAIYGPAGGEHAAAALLRADIGAGRTGRGKAMPMYVSASRQDVARSVWLYRSCRLSDAGALPLRAMAAV